MLQCTTRRAPARGGGLDHRSHGRGVDRAVSSSRQAGLPVDRGDVVDDVDAADGASSDARSSSVAHGELDSRQSAERGRLCRIADERANGVAPRGKRAREVAAGEAGRAGD